MKSDAKIRTFSDAAKFIFLARLKTELPHHTMAGEFIVFNVFYYNSSMSSADSPVISEMSVTL